MYLTEKQKKIYSFIRDYITQHNISPTFEEIKREFGLKSVGTVAGHIKILEKKGFLTRGGVNQKRALQPVSFGKKSITIPLVGTVSAGNPLEVYEIQEYIDVPEEMLGRGENVALKVRGDSMIDSGIFDGDIVIVKRQSNAENGQIFGFTYSGEERTGFSDIRYSGWTLQEVQLLSLPGLTGLTRAQSIRCCTRVLVLF